MATLYSDPTRTTTLRKRFMADTNRRVKQLTKWIKEFIVDYDALGLGDTSTLLKLNVLPETQFRQYQFETDAGKVRAFQNWLSDQIDKGVLEVDFAGKPWTNQYIDSAYRKGVVRAYTDTHKLTSVDTTDFFDGTKAQFLESAFALPETTAKVELLYTRAFENMRGFTAQVSQETGRILADGISNGEGPRVIARKMDNAIGMLNRKRALVIARTETIHAHSEGQLDTFEKLGVEKLGVQAEWSTAGDDRVCSRCAPMEGAIMTVQEARGLIPLHPSCRCTWIPYDPVFDQVGKR